MFGFQVQEDDVGFLLDVDIMARNPLVALPPLEDMPEKKRAEFIGGFRLDLVIFNAYASDGPEKLLAEVFGPRFDCAAVHHGTRRVEIVNFAPEGRGKLRAEGFGPRFDWAFRGAGRSIIHHRDTRRGLAVGPINHDPFGPLNHDPVVVCHGADGVSLTMLM